MENLEDNLESLFLLEVLVDFVKFDKPPKEENLRETCVGFQFLHYPPLIICEEDFVNMNDDEFDQQNVPFKSGKSLLFALPSLLDGSPNLGNIHVWITRRVGKTEKSIVMGSTDINLSGSFENLLQASAQRQETGPLSKFIKDTFRFKKDGVDIGHISTFLRISCFGKLIVTQFHVKGKDQFNFRGLQADNDERGDRSGADKVHGRASGKKGVSAIGSEPGMVQATMAPGMAPGMGQPGMAPGWGQHGMAPGMGQPGMAPGWGQPGMGPGMGQAGMAPGMGLGMNQARGLCPATGPAMHPGMGQGMFGGNPFQGVPGMSQGMGYGGPMGGRGPQKCPTVCSGPKTGFHGKKGTLPCGEMKCPASSCSQFPCPHAACCSLGAMCPCSSPTTSAPNVWGPGMGGPLPMMMSARAMGLSGNDCPTDRDTQVTSEQIVVETGSKSQAGRPSKGKKSSKGGKKGKGKK